MRALSLLLVAAVGVGANTLIARHANACSRLGLVPHELDAGERGVDTTAPEPPRVTGVMVSRSYGPRDDGCTGHSGSSCDGSGSIGIEIADGTDDRTPPERMGYRIVRTGGRLPSGLTLPGAVRKHGGFIWLDYSDPGPDDQPPIDVSFQLFAVDLAGNESAGSDLVRARDDGAEGCAIASVRGGFAAALFGLTAAALLLRIGRRRR